MRSLRSAGGPAAAGPALTPPYAAWIAEAVGAHFHNESASTCADCVMCRPQLEDLTPQFNPAIKCCTYWPNLPNFLVGRILRAGGEGARRLEDLIRRRVGLTPFGMEASPAYDRDYAQVSGRFGRALELRCPLYDNGSCTIWAHRNSMCQTYFCRTDQGIPGSARWRELTWLLMYLEEQLAVNAATRRLSHATFYQQGFDEKGARGRVSLRTLGGWVEDDGVVPEALNTALFGPWAGREREFFLDCAREVDELGWADVKARLGHGLDVMVGRLQAGLDSPLPTEVRRPSLGVELTYAPTEGGVAWMAGAGPAVVHRATPEIWAALEAFEAGTIGEEGLDLAGIHLDRDTALSFWRDGLLIAGPARSLTPLQPEDRLRVQPAFTLVEQLRFAPDGSVTVDLNAGAAELSFDEPGTLEFGRKLVARARGFTASEAVGWGHERSWEDVAPMLTTLLEMGVLEQVWVHEREGR